MIVILKNQLKKGSPELKQLEGVAARYPGLTLSTHNVKGAIETISEVYVFGPTLQVPTAPFEELPFVQKVVRVSSKYRIIGSHEGQVDAVGFEYKGLKFHQDSFHVFAGLCAVDTRQHVEMMMKALRDAGLDTTRMGAYKPRTSPYEFQGHGKECLPYVFELAGKYKIKAIAMEVTHESQLEEIRDALRSAGDPTGVIVQIGTRNAQNFELLKHVGRQTEFPVLFKRGMGITLEESLNACEYIASNGNSRIIFCLRGMKTNLGDPHRNLVDFAHVPVVKRLTRLPVCIDPSHSVGKKVLAPDGLLDIQHAGAQGIIAGANMLIVDFHPRPEAALCDGPQALLLKELEFFLEDVNICRDAYEKRKTAASRFARSSGKCECK
ncbi:3-deoxy-7-phosphoheptulonate synthase [bacterium]|nr:MAG: 3-deoxy-7-phosphoheptulonate synthase [bacterium]